MAKSKNHTFHNQSFKQHRNGIKKPLRAKYASTTGMCQKFMRNQRYAKANNYKYKLKFKGQGKSLEVKGQQVKK